MGWWKGDFGEVYSGALRKLPAPSFLAPRVAHWSDSLVVSTKATGVIRGSPNLGPEVEFFVQSLDVGF